MVRSRLRQNAGMKLLALLLAVILWGMVFSQRLGRSTELVVTTPLLLQNVPPELQVVEAPIQAVSVQISVERAFAGKVNPGLFQAHLNLANQVEGSKRHNLSPRDITYNNTPLSTNMRVLGVTPGWAKVTLEQVEERVVQIKPRVSGEPEKGYVIHSLEVNPQRVRVRGPRTRIKKLFRVYTSAVDVSRANQDIEITTDLEIPSLVQIDKDSPERVQVKVRLINRPSRLRLEGIPIQFENTRNAYKASTKRLNVFLEGPEEQIKRLSIKNVYAVVDMTTFPPGDYRAISPKVVLPDRVKVLEQWPILDLLVINRPLTRDGTPAPR